MSNILYSIISTLFGELQRFMVYTQVCSLHLLYTVIQRLDFCLLCPRSIFFLCRNAWAIFYYIKIISHSHAYSHKIEEKKKRQACPAHVFYFVRTGMTSLSCPCFLFCADWYDKRASCDGEKSALLEKPAEKTHIQ